MAGMIEIRPNTSTKLGVGTKTGISNTAVALVAAATPAAGVLIQNDPDNTVDMLVGNATDQTFQLVPGQAIFLPVPDVAQVYVKMASAVSSVCNFLYTV